MTRRHDPAAQQQHDGGDDRQMHPYAREHGPYGQGEDPRNWGAPPRRDSELSHHDPVQASYGRASAPDVHRAPSGGYQRDHRADAGYNRPAYVQQRGDQGYGSHDARQGGGYGGYPGEERAGYGNQSLRRDEPWRPGPYQDHGPGYMGRSYDEARDWQRRHPGGGSDEGYGRFQGGAGGYRSNAGPYAGSQTYGGYGDQLGYGSTPPHHDPDYHQWREQQMRQLDEDYQSWRGERYKRFSDDFETWRRERALRQAGGQQQQGQGPGQNQGQGQAGAGEPAQPTPDSSSGKPR